MLLIYSKVTWYSINLLSMTGVKLSRLPSRPVTDFIAVAVFKKCTLNIECWRLYQPKTYTDERIGVLNNVLATKDKGSFVYQQVEGLKTSSMRKYLLKLESTNSTVYDRKNVRLRDGCAYVCTKHRLGQSSNNWDIYKTFNFCYVYIGCDSR